MGSWTKTLKAGEYNPTAAMALRRYEPQEMTAEQRREQDLRIRAWAAEKRVAELQARVAELESGS